MGSQGIQKNLTQIRPTMKKIKQVTTGWISEFKEFALKGNVVDMAIGVIIGGAFGKIVTSLVNDIIMPSITLMFGEGKSLATLAYQGIKYGNFLQTVVDFLIIALSIFFAIRLICKLRFKKKTEEATPAEPPAPAPTPEDILLLREIRDALKNK